MSRTCSSSSVVRKYSVVSFGVQVLTGIGDTSNIPGLKAFAGVALNVVEFCKSAVSNKDEWASLSEDICRLAMAVASQLEAQKGHLEAGIIEKIELLCRQLEAAHSRLHELSNRPSFSWFARHAEDSVTLQRLGMDIRRALDLFTVNANIEVERASYRLALSLQQNTAFLETIKGVPQAELAEIMSGDVRPNMVSAVLPPYPRIFFGRENEIDLVVHTITGQPPGRVAIVGSAGMGKSTMAAKVLHDPRVADAFDARRFFIPCDSVEGRDGILTAIASRLGIQGDLHNKVIGSLGEARAVLVLDNFESPWEPMATKTEVEQLLSTFAGLENLAMVVTMRGSERPGNVAWSRPFLRPLQPLDISAARQAFVTISDRPESDPCMDELLKAIDCVPLALTLMATLAQSDNTASLLQRWEEERSSMLHNAPDRRTSLNYSIKLSLQSPRIAIIPEARELLGLLSWLPDGIENRELEEVFPRVGRCRRALSTLRQTSLAFDEANGRTRVLAPICAYMLLHYQPDSAAQLSMMTYYVRLAGRGGEVGRTDGQAVVRRLSSEIRNIQSVLNFVLDAQSNIDTSLLRKAITAATHIARFTRYTNFGSPKPVQLALAAAERLRDIPLRADTSFHLAWMLSVSKTNDTSEELCSSSLALYQQVDNIGGQAECMWLMGNMRKNTKRQRECRNFFEKGLSLAEQSGVRLCKAKCLSALSEITFYAGQVDISESQCKAALSIFLEEEHLTNVGLCHFWLGRIAEMRCAYRNALEHYTEACKVLEKAGADREHGQVLISMGDISMARCDFVKAREDYEAALAVFRQRGFLKRSVTGYAQLSLGTVAASLNEVTTAVGWLEAAGRTFELGGGIHGILHCRIIFGDLALQAERYPEAEEYYQQALASSRSAGFMDEEAVCNIKTGVLAHQRQQGWRAIKHLIIGFTLHRSMTSMVGQANAMIKLADAFVSEGDLVTASALYRVVYPIYFKLEALRGMADCLQGMGRTSSLQSRIIQC